jgi:hypothetical protein
MMYILLKLFILYYICDAYYLIYDATYTSDVNYSYSQYNLELFMMQFTLGFVLYL